MRDFLYTRHFNSRDFLLLLRLDEHLLLFELFDIDLLLRFDVGEFCLALGFGDEFSGLGIRLALVFGDFAFVVGLRAQGFGLEFYLFGFGEALLQIGLALLGELGLGVFVRVGAAVNRERIDVDTLLEQVLVVDNRVVHRLDELRELVAADDCGGVELGRNALRHRVEGGIHLLPDFLVVALDLLVELDYRLVVGSINSVADLAGHEGGGLVVELYVQGILLGGGIGADVYAGLGIDPDGGAYLSPPAGLPPHHDIARNRLHDGEVQVVELVHEFPRDKREEHAEYDDQCERQSQLFHGTISFECVEFTSFESRVDGRALRTPEPRTSWRGIPGTSCATAA